MDTKRGHRRLWTHDPRYGRRYIEGLRARVPHEGGGYLLETNSSGFRCRHEFRNERVAGRHRALLFGDSFTAGTGVSDGARWGDLLDDAIPELDVYNFAIAGAGLDEQLLVARHHARSVQADVVIIGLWTDTVQRVTARHALVRADHGELLYRPKAYFTLDATGGLVTHNVPVPDGTVPQTSLSEEDHRRAPGPAAAHCNAAAYEHRDHPDTALVAAIVNAFASELQLPLVVVLLPPFRHVEGSDDPGPTHHWMMRLERSGIEVVDPLPALATRPAAERRALRFDIDYHPTPAYHATVAQVALPRLANRLERETAT